ncbi:glycosyltransferase family 4 protein [Halomicrococcus sp. NG-SE-24]|uniref:glycosyltransferase family 4 protein n=1 Tax=Halomicrococcus sp. NG-SE-24 TaxID=3436928 RepID=UPI003D973B2A
MDLTLVVYGSLDEQSGGFRYDRRLVDSLRDRGHAVDVVSLPWTSYARALTHNYGSGLPSRLADADVVVEDELCHPSLVAANRRVDAPVVTVVHHLRSSEPRGRWRNAAYRAVERRYLRGVDAAVCNGETTRATVAALADLPTAVAPPAGDRFAPVDATATSAPGDGPLELCFLGNLEPRKGIHVLLDGLAQVDGDWHLTVVGGTADPGYGRRVRRRVRALDLRDRVTFVGRLPDDAVADRLAESHLLTVPSLYEGVGLVYLEAMAFGVPALATTAGGASEVVTDGENGLLVPPGDATAVADAVRRVRNDRDLLRALSEGARRRFERQPDWDDAADAVEALLREVGPA